MTFVAEHRLLCELQHLLGNDGVAMVASFMQEPGVAQRAAIPVPKGPVEVW